MIELKEISKRYSNGEAEAPTLVLDHVDMQVRENEFVCLIGPSGCGKSTLLNLVAGFVRPTSGRVVFHGEDVTGPGPDRGVVFQEATLFPWLTTKENVEFGLVNARVPASERGKRSADCLKLVGLNGFHHAYPHALSGGMKQRAALARVLVLNPLALLMDEPFSALDENSRERLQDELLRIWVRRTTTVLFVTHNVGEAAYLADRIIVMGPAPGTIREEMPVPLGRPRDRNSAAFRDLVELLRGKLGTMPCCVPVQERNLDHG